jgi:TRAP-type mannitol/chloroaromatic compound transport system permease large subunit
MHITGMIMWIVVAGACFSSVFTIIGAQEFITGAIQEIGVNRWMILIGIQVILLFLGTLLDPNAIMMLSIPIFVPIVRALGFDSLWFGVVSVMNIETGLVTPPFGMNLFYVKGITYKDTSMMEIYRSVIPFIVVQVLNIALCMVFPRIITLLPSLVIGK